MGLAPYGQPVFFDSRFVGNEIDIRRQFDSDLWTAWSDHCRKEATARGYDISALGDPARVTEAVNADIAASTQKLFEETYLKAVRSLDRMLSGGGIRTDNLCLSGGTALNCPSNSRIWREGPFDNVFIEPTCEDGGLAIGAPKGQVLAEMERVLISRAVSERAAYLLAGRLWHADGGRRCGQRGRLGVSLSSAPCPGRRQVTPPPAASSASCASVKRKASTISVRLGAGTGTGAGVGVGTSSCAYSQDLTAPRRHGRTEDDANSIVLG